MRIYTFPVLCVSGGVVRHCDEGPVHGRVVLVVADVALEDRLAVFQGALVYVFEVTFVMEFVEGLLLLGDVILLRILFLSCPVFERCPYLRVIALGSIPYSYFRLLGICDFCSFVGPQIMILLRNIVVIKLRILVGLVHNFLAQFATHNCAQAQQCDDQH